MFFNRCLKIDFVDSLSERPSRRKACLNERTIDMGSRDMVVKTMLYDREELWMSDGSVREGRAGAHEPHACCARQAALQLIREMTRVPRTH